jgi:hypothetical protein
MPLWIIMILLKKLYLKDLDQYKFGVEFQNQQIKLMIK